MSQKLVSVIIPTYNRAYSVVEAIQSVKNQTYSAIQLIVIDDGSRDNTAECVSRFTDIEYYYQENKGQAAARNLGLKYAKGEYLASLDSDDMWDRDFLTEGAKCLEKHDLDFVFLNWISVDGKENFLDIWERNKKWQKYIKLQDEQWKFIEAAELRQIFLYACPSPTSSLLLRRSSLASSWNEEISVADDWFLLLEMVFTKPCRAAFTLSPFWLKRVFGDNIYDGRDILEVIKNGLHDDLLMVGYLESRMTAAEKYIIRKRIALTYLNFGRLSWKIDSDSRKMFSGIAQAVAMSPLGVSYQLIEIFMNSLKYRMKLVSPADKIKEISKL